MATNPVVSMPDSDKIRRALEKCECVVVSDISANADIAKYADILLPAAGWGEKQGMVSNSERCLTRQRQFIQPPGEAKPDWWMVSQVGRQLCQLMQVDSGFEFKHEAEVFREYASMTGLNQNTPLQLDISALETLTNDEYHAWQPQRWPVTKNSRVVAKTLKQNGLECHDSKIKYILKDVFLDKQSGAFHFPTLSGKANFVLTKPCIKKSLEKHRWWLNSGRQRDQWHTMTRTGHIAHLSASEVEPTVYINRLDAENANLKPDNLIAIRQGDNQLKAKLAIDDNLTHGQAFMSMHWAGEYGKTSQVNRVLKGVVDPHSAQPAFKSQAISIYAQTVASYGISAGINFTLKHWDYLSLQHVQFQTGMQTQAKAGSTTSNFQKGIWRFAHSIAISKAEIQAQIKATHPRCKFLSLDHEQGWSMAGLVNDKVVSVISVNDQPLKLAAEALISLINQPLNLTQLLSALSSNQSQNSKLICSCFRVTEADILQVLEERTSVSLAELQTTLKYGTNCGSCLPEVNRYLQTQKIDVLAVITTFHLAQKGR